MEDYKKLLDSKNKEITHWKNQAEIQHAMYLQYIEKRN